MITSNITNHGETPSSPELNLGLNAENLVMTVSPPSGNGAIRRRAEQVSATIARTSGRYWSVSGWACIFCAVVAAACAWVLPMGGLLAGITAAIMLFMGILTLALVDGRKPVRLVDGFFAFGEQALVEWEQACDDRASALGRRWQEAIDRFIRQQQAQRSPAEIKSMLEKTLSQAQVLDRQLDSLLVAAVREAQACMETTSSKNNELHRRAALWTSRFNATRIWSLARQAVEGREKTLHFLLQRSALEALQNHASKPLLQVLEDSAGYMANDQLECLTMTESEEAQPDVITPGTIELPAVHDIQREVRALINAQLPQIRVHCANRPRSVPIEVALREVVAKIVKNHPVTSDNISSHLERLNGQSDSFFRDALGISSEWAHYNSAIRPGQRHWTISTLIANGDANASLYRQLKNVADGQVLRALNTDSLNEVTIITESRFEHPDCQPALATHADVLAQLTPEQWAVAVPVEDVEFLTRYCPEQPENNQAIMRTISLGLVLGVLVRAGNVLKISPAYDCGNLPGGRLGRGWEQATAALKTNHQLFALLNNHVETAVAARGSDEMIGLLDAALQNPQLVPADQLDEARSALVAERERIRR